MDFKEAADLVRKDAWAGLSVEEKLDVLRTVEAENAKREGRDPMPIYALNDANPVNYSNDMKAIYIRASALEDSINYPAVQYFAEAVLHMDRHLYQFNAIEGKVEHKNKAQLEIWKDELTGGEWIRKHKNPRGHAQQLAELDAREYAKSRMDILFRTASPDIKLDDLIKKANEKVGERNGKSTLKRENEKDRGR